MYLIEYFFKIWLEKITYLNFYRRLISQVDFDTKNSTLMTFLENSFVWTRIKILRFRKNNCLLKIHNIKDSTISFLVGIFP
jgi:hypothetical protein